MGRLLLLLATLVAGASSFVYTCNEVKQMLDTEFNITGTRACAVLPAAVKFPFNDDPYSWYLYNTYLVDIATGTQWELSGLEENHSFCVDGDGPWTIKSDEPYQFTCSSNKFKYAEIIFLFTSDEPNIVRAETAPATTTLGKGTHVFVAPEGSLLIEKKSIADGKETTLQFYSGAGANEQEERVALMPEKFVAGSSTVIIGPVTTLVIEDDVTIELTLTSFQDTQFISALPGFSFSLMSTGRANDLQSSRPSILVSTAYDINDDSFEYDALSITGTVKMEDTVATTLTIDCNNKETGQHTVKDITDTSDIIINNDCSSLDITYKGSLAPEDIGRSSEVIYLRIDSNSDPVLQHSTTPKGRRTPPATSPETTHSTVTPPTTASRLPSSTTAKAVQTTTSASGISLVSLLIVSVLFI